MSHKNTRRNMNPLALIQKYMPQILSWLQGQTTKQMEKPEPPPVVVAVDPVPVPATKKVSFKLTRKEFRPDGIFSELVDQNGKLVAHTLEHSYDNLPKITNGTWKCVRGPHRLHNMTEDFITFEITGIAGHTDLLFHWGNYDKDSEGCVLVGEAVVQNGAIEMITNSRATFAKFMDSLNGIDEFEVTVS